MIRNCVIPVSVFVCLLSVTVFASQEKALFETGVGHLKQHRYEAAIEVFTELIELDPENPDVYKNRGVAHMKLSQYDAAIQDFEKTKEMMPDLKGLHSNLGVAWYYKGEYEKAIASYDMEIALSPGSHYAYFNRAICWAELRKYDKSMEDIDQTLMLAPDFYLAHCLKGDLYLELGDSEAARAAYEKAVEVDSEAEYARNQLDALGPAPGVRETRKSGEITAPMDSSPQAPPAEEPAGAPTEQPEIPAAKHPGEPPLSETDPGVSEMKEPGRPSPEPEPDPEYEIQIGAFQVQENARDRLSELQALGYEARILTVTRPNKVTWYLVRTGAFSERKTAEQAMAQFVKETGMKAYVRPWNRF